MREVFARKECILIATIPSLSNMKKVSKVISEPAVSEVRYNTGMRSPFSPKETLERLYHLAKAHNKKLWIDLKGRQLRVNSWADPLYECVELNHNISVDLPAKIIFRGGSYSEISYIDGNKVFLSEPPREPLGKGQSVNIIGSNLQTEDGYLTQTDNEYLSVLSEFPLEDVGIMASFVESKKDIDDICSALGDYMYKASYCAKIESEKGLDFVLSAKKPPFLTYMAARDDLFIELEKDFPFIIHVLRAILHNDRSSICASRIFSSLERDDTPCLADFGDLELMYRMGFRKFMLSDSVCTYAFDNAIKAWEEFLNA